MCARVMSPWKAAVSMGGWKSPEQNWECLQQQGEPRGSPSLVQGGDRSLPSWMSSMSPRVHCAEQHVTSSLSPS